MDDIYRLIVAVMMDKNSMDPSTRNVPINWTVVFNSLGQPVRMQPNLDLVQNTILIRMLASVPRSIMQAKLVWAINKNCGMVSIWVEPRSILNILINASIRTKIFFVFFYRCYSNIVNINRWKELQRRWTQDWCCS